VPIPLVVAALGAAAARKATRGRQDTPRTAAGGVPPVPLDVLAELPTDRLVQLMNQALQAPDRAPRVSVPRALAEQIERGLDALEGAIGDREAQAVAALRAQARSTSPADRNRQLDTIRRGALADVQAVASLLRPGTRIGGAPASPGVLSRLRGYATSLHTYALEALGRNAEFAGSILDLLSQRVANAARVVADGAGDAFAAFWGISPGGAVGTVVVVGVLVAVLGAFLLLSPAGQAYLVGQGAGAAAIGKGGGAFAVSAGKSLVRFIG
jgi:hypothetical protein